MQTNDAAIRIAYADDDDDDRELFRLALTKINVDTKIITFDNGQQLMNYLKNTSSAEPNIIFLDINMPGKSGLKCLEEIRLDGKMADVPVIMFTTSDHGPDITATFKAGANLYVTKPPSFPILVKMLTQVLALNKEGRLKKPTQSTFVLPEIPPRHR